MNETKEEWTLRRIVAYALIAMGVLWALGTLLHALPVLIGVAVLLGPPIWVYLDGTKRGLDRAPLWALLVLLSNVVGLVIYLIARPDAVLRDCARCGAAMRPEWRVCARCGNETNAPRSCPSCSTPTQRDWRHCPKCKAELPAETRAVVETES